MIRLEEITPDNWRLGLSVKEEQKRFVSDSNRILARAWAYRNSRSRAFVICDDETPVGMAMYKDWVEGKAYDLSQLFIDARYQGRGFGTEASEQILERMKADGRYDRVILCFVDGNDAARRMYERLGFSLTGEADGDEILMEKKLQ